MAFGDTQNFIDGFNPGRGEGFFVDDGGENGAKRFAKAQDAKENRIHGRSLSRNKRAKASGPILGDQASIDKEGNEFVPGKVAAGGREVGEIEGQAAGDQWGSGAPHQETPNGRGSGITGVLATVGYTTTAAALRAQAPSNMIE